MIGLGSRGISFSLAALLALAGCRQPAGSESRQAAASPRPPAAEDGRGPAPQSEDCEELSGRLAELARLAAADEAAGHQAWLSGDAERAADLFSGAAAERRKTGQIRWEISDLLFAGLALRRLGSAEAARRHFLQAEELATADPYPAGRAAAANNLALLEQDAGNFALARFHFGRALRLLTLETSPEGLGEAALYRENLARLMIVEGERAEAGALLRQKPKEIASSSELAELAWLLLLEQRPGEAHAAIAAALAADPDVFTAAVLHDRRGTALERLGRPAEAHAAYLLALDLAEGTTAASTRAATAVNLCRLQALTPLSLFADDNCAPAVAAARRPGVPAATLASALLWQALELQRRGKPREAYAAARGAARRVAVLREQASSPERRARFLEDRSLYVSLAVELAMELHRRNPELAFDRAALADSELWRARSLAEEVAGLRSGDTLQQELREARREVRFPPTRSEPADARIAHLETRLQARRRSQPEQPFDLGQVQRRLDGETTIFDLLLGEKSSYLWRIGATEIASYELPAAPELENLARRFFDLIANPAATSRRVRMLGAGRELGDALFGKDLERLDGSGRRLVFVGDGELAAFPLAALPMPRSTPAAPTFLVEHKEIVALPSLRMLGVLQQTRAPGRQPSRSLALVGDPWYGWEAWRRILRLEPVPAAEVLAQTGIAPPFALGRLPFSSLEMDLVASHVSGRGATLRAQGPAATRELVLSGALDSYAVLHFSAHGELDPRSPQSAAILLSELDRAGRRRQGRLTPEDLADSCWQAELAVASSCESASGLPFRFEGLGGIARAFFYAGAGRSLASLWKVEGKATGQLMNGFFEALTARRLPPGEALRSAQRALLEKARAAGDPWKAPYYWSGFTLIGDWREFLLPGSRGRAEHPRPERV